MTRRKFDELVKRIEARYASRGLLWHVVERADQVWTGQACQALEDHYRATGQADRQSEVRARQDRHDVVVKEAQQERSRIDASDAFLHHGLTGEQLEPLRRLLAACSDCSSAWLVRKKLRHFPDRPAFVLCARCKPRRWNFGRADREQQLAKRLIPSMELPGQVLVIAPAGHLRGLARKVMAITDAQIFRAADAETSIPRQAAAT